MALEGVRERRGTAGIFSLQPKSQKIGVADASSKADMLKMHILEAQVSFYLGRCPAGLPTLCHPIAGGPGEEYAGILHP